jgi:hypothetical protein
MPKTGDYGCVHTPGFIGKMIRLFLHSKVNHAFIYIGKGQIVEARPKGATLSKANKYTNVLWSNENLSKEERDIIANRALVLIGTPYGFFDIFFLWLKTIGVNLPFVENWISREDEMICSQLVTDCYKHAGISLSNKPENEVTPQDLYLRALEK